MKISSGVLSVFLLGIGYAGEAHAWGAIGHGTVGAIAESVLTPRAKALVFSILGPEPLAVAANFPDAVRSDHRFDKFSAYHFSSISAAGSYADIPHPDRDMNSISIKAMKMLAKRSVSRDEKMLYLRYLVHIIGDIHQPLHTSVAGYLGGNTCSVKVADPATGIVGVENIHHFWDETLIEFERREYYKKVAKPGSEPWFGYAEYAKETLADPVSESIRAEVDAAGPVRDTDFVGWITETGKIGETAYPKVPEKNPGMRPYCDHIDPVTRVTTKKDPATFPLLDETYVSRWIPTVRAQVLRGGFRLAKVLDRIAENAHLKAKNVDEREQKLLQSILSR